MNEEQKVDNIGVEEYIIKCTHIKKGRNIRESQDLKHIKCNNPKFIVKWNQRTQIATVKCSLCQGVLFDYKLNEVVLSEEVTNGQPINNNNNNSSDSTNNSADLGDNNNKEVNKLD